MIIVVEGPSAAGKSTWSRTHAPTVLIEEAGPTTGPPVDQEEAARFWAENGASRWEQALGVERKSRVAVCDTDPLKLHYAWSLCRIGAGSDGDFWRQASAYREMVASRRLGFADWYLLGVPDLTMLAARKAADHSRHRRNFELHRRLADPLREWYATVDKLRPGSVVWEFPDTGIDALPSVHRSRYDLETFDALVDHLGGLVRNAR